MDGSRRNRQLTILIGIGLVLVGLMTGIFVMLLYADLRPAKMPPAQTVERVELGRKSAVRNETAEPVASLEVPDTVAAD